MKRKLLRALHILRQDTEQFQIIILLVLSLVIPLSYLGVRYIDLQQQLAAETGVTVSRLGSWLERNENRWPSDVKLLSLIGYYGGADSRLTVQLAGRPARVISGEGVFGLMRPTYSAGASFDFGENRRGFLVLERSTAPLLYTVLLLSLAGLAMAAALISLIAYLRSHAWRGHLGRFFRLGTATEITLGSIQEGVVTTDSHGRVEYMNPVAERLAGRPREGAVGEPVERIFPLSDKAGSALFQHPIRFALTPGASSAQYQSSVLTDPAGTEHVLDVYVQPLHDSQNRISGAMMLIQDLGSQRKALERLNWLKRHDPLTGLPNNALIAETLEQALGRARHSQDPVGVLYLNLDRFSVINEGLGHYAGNHVLSLVGQRLQAALPAGVSAGRLGGDEFVVILEGSREEERLHDLARGILAALAPPFPVGRTEVFVTPSIGICRSSDCNASATRLLAQANQAMIRAKKMGRNTYQLYSGTMSGPGGERLRLDTDLRYALERQEFRLHYQPRIDTQSGNAVGMEALLRWQHPGLGLIPPDRFVPLLEETGLIHEVSAWILAEACRQTVRVHEEGFPSLNVSVNLSARQLYQRDFAGDVAAILAQSGLAPHFLELELTETLLLDTSTEVMETLGKLKALGIRFSIDDFGTGYSSFGYLRRLPIDTLKIDKSFIKEVTTREDDGAIVQAIIAMACRLRLKVLAEGVENAEQVRWLRDFGCNELQGYYYSRPLPPGQLLPWLKVHYRRHLPEAESRT